MDDVESPLDAYSAAIIKVVQAVGPSVASIAVRGERGREGAGSGVVIGDRVLVTNAHVAGAQWVAHADHRGRDPD